MYIGNQPAQSFATVTSQTINGDGGATYTLNRAVNNGEELEVFVNNVQQQPTVAYTASSTTLTFTENVPSATGNIYVIYRGLAQNVGQDENAPRLIGDNTLTGNQTITGDLTTTGAFTSKGIDDNADATAITIDANEDVELNNGGLYLNGSLNSLTVDKGGIDRSGNTTRIISGRSGGNFADFSVNIAGSGGVNRQLYIDYQGNTTLDNGILNLNNQITMKRAGTNTAFRIEDSSNSNFVVFTLTGATYNGGTNKLSSFNTTSLSLNPQNSDSLNLGTDGSLRLQHVYDDTTSNSANMYIHSDGIHQVMRSTSSERYKKNIETLEDKYADAVLGLRPVWYKSKCEADNPDYSHWGLIAEEVAKVDPRLVTFRNEITTSNDDPDTGETIIKTTKLDEPQAESVQYDRFVPHLINICKRQEDKITALEARIKALEEA